MKTQDTKDGEKAGKRKPVAKPGEDHAAAARKANAAEAKTLRRVLDKMYLDMIRLADGQHRHLSRLMKAYEKTRAGYDRVYEKAEDRVAREEAKIERRLAILEGRGV